MVPRTSFVVIRVRGTHTAYLNQNYMLVFYPHLCQHVEASPHRHCDVTYNPVFAHTAKTHVEILLYADVTQMVPLDDQISTYMHRFWDQPGIPKSGKKAMINTSIGMLGTKTNDIKPWYKAVIVESMEEMSLLGADYNSENYNILNIDDTNLAIVPSVQQCVNRYQTGMAFYQTIVDEAVLHVDHAVDSAADPMASSTPNAATTQSNSTTIQDGRWNGTIRSTAAATICAKRDAYS